MILLAISELRLQKAGQPCSSLEDQAVALHVVLDPPPPFLGITKMGYKRHFP